MKFKEIRKQSSRCYVSSVSALLKKAVTSCKLTDRKGLQRLRKSGPVWRGGGGGVRL